MRGSSGILGTAHDLLIFFSNLTEFTILWYGMFIGSNSENLPHCPSPRISFALLLNKAAFNLGAKSTGSIHGNGEKVFYAFLNIRRKNSSFKHFLFCLKLNQIYLEIEKIKKFGHS